jgi:hypothetical protein
MATVQLELFYPEGFTTEYPNVTSNIEEYKLESSSKWMQ